MTLHPPKIVIDANDPFREALFGRKEFAEALTGVLRELSDGLVVFVNAPWGTGKTTFAEMWRAQLRQQKLEVIYYNAYAEDYFDDPFVSFSGEIIGLVDKRLEGGKGLVERREFKDTAVEVAKRLSGLAVKIGLRAATLGAVESAHISELQQIGSQLADGVSDIGAKMVEKKIDDYTAEKDALAVFKQSLGKLAKKVREEQGFPLTIIVDELDRCRPDFALGLLERIKHLFDVEGVAFVLLVNREQIETYIRAVYGEKVDACAYLLKFGNLFVDLPNQQSAFANNYVSGRTEYCEKLFAHFGLAKRVADGRSLIKCAGIFGNHFDVTLREIERVFAVMTIHYGACSRDWPDFLVLMLAILKVKNPVLYQSLSKGTISASEFRERAALDRIVVSSADHVDPEWMQDWIDYCLMSEVELDAAIKVQDGSGRERHQLKVLATQNWANRIKIIPKLCWRLDRFSLQPG